MSKRFNIKPPIWPKEYTFQEFVKLNPHIINENQLITLYNQYLNKYLTELGEKKIHFKQSKVNQLLTELKDLKFDNIVNINAPGGGYQFYSQYSMEFSGDTTTVAWPDINEKTYMSTTFNPNNFNLNAGFTVSFWVNTRQFPTNAHFLGAKMGNAQNFRFGTQTNTKIQVKIGGDTHNGSNHGMSLNTWHHYVVTYDGTTMLCYIDGNEITGGGVSMTWSNTSNTNTNRGIYFGASNEEGDYDDGVSCLIDECAIFDEVKSLSSLHDGNYKPIDQSKSSGLVGYWRFENNTLDSSGNDNHGTLATDKAGGTSLPTYSTNTPTYSGNSY